MNKALFQTIVTWWKIMLGISLGALFFDTPVTWALEISTTPSQQHFGGNSGCCAAWGDVDGDGDLDLAVGYEYSTDELHLNNNGLIQTSASWSSFLPTGTKSLAWGDFDNDGDLDLAVGRLGNNVIYENLGTGPKYLHDAQTVWKDTRNNENTMEIAWADIDDNGQLDLVAANRAGPVVVHYNWNDRKADFNHTFATTETNEAFCLALGLLTADPYPDIVIGQVGSGKNRIYFNTGGSIPPTHSWEAADYQITFDTAIGDIDGDGLQDVVFANYNRGNQFYRNSGGTTPTFAKVWTESASNKATRSVALYDIDQDGRLEVAFGHKGITPLEIDIYKYDPIHMTLEDTPAWNSQDKPSCHHLTFADVDGDGAIDLFSMNMDNWQLYQNEQRDYPLNGTSLSVVGKTNEVEYCYFNKEMTPDLFEVNFGEVDKIYFNTQSPAGWTSGQADNSVNAAVGDIDNNNYLDIVVATSGGPSVMYYNQGGSVLQVPQWEVLDLNDTRCVVVGDIDGDIDQDIFFGREFDTLLGYKVNVSQSGGMPTIDTDPFWRSDPVYRARDLVLADLDGNGTKELIVAHFHGPDAIHLNTGETLQTGSVWQSPNDYNTTCLDVGDIDQDGHLDIVFGYKGQRTQVFFTNGNIPQPGTGPQWTANQHNNPRGKYAYQTKDVRLFDVDHDGDLDLIEINGMNETSGLSDPDCIYFNHNGVLEDLPSWERTAPGNSSSVTFGDYDYDGDWDMLVGVYNGRNLVYKSKYAPAPNTDLLPNDDPYGKIIDFNYTVVTKKLIVRYVLYDDESDLCSIIPQYSINNGGAWENATEASNWHGVPSNGTTNLLSRPYPTGRINKFIWDADADQVNNDRVLFRLLIYAYPTVCGLMQRPAFETKTYPMDVKAVPEVLYYMPVENGVDNRSISLEYAISERIFKDPTDPLDPSRVTFTFEWNGGDSLCPDLQGYPSTQIVSVFLQGTQINPLLGDPLPKINSIIIEADDLNADRDTTTDDQLVDQCTYHVTIEVCDEANNCYYETHNDWRYDNVAVTLLRMKVCDNAPVLFQDPSDICKMTNELDVFVDFNWTGVADKVWWTQVPGNWQPNRSYDLPDPAAGIEQITVTLTGGDCSAEKLYLKLTDAANNDSNILDYNILVDQLYDYNLIFPPQITIGDGSKHQSTPDLNIVWSGMIDLCSGLHGTYYYSTALGTVWPGWDDQYANYTTKRKLRLNNVPPGWFDIHLRNQDHAGNRSQWFSDNACIDIENPVFPANAEPVFNNDPTALFNNELPVELDWPDATDTGCAGIRGYQVKIAVDGISVVDTWVQSSQFIWADPPELGLARACITCEDWAGNRSSTICKSVNLDRVPPKIFLAGYLNEIYSDLPGEFYMLAYVPDDDVRAVNLHTQTSPPYVFDKDATQLLDQDNGIQTSFGPCGFGLGDGFYGLCGQLPEGIKQGCFLLGLRAYDFAGNGSTLWPFLTIYAVNPSCPSGMPPTPTPNPNPAPGKKAQVNQTEYIVVPFEGLDKDIKVRVLNEETFLDMADYSLLPAEELYKLQDAVEVFMDIRQKYLDGETYNQQAIGIRGGPHILAAGYWDSQIWCEAGGDLSIAAVVVDPNYPDCSSISVKWTELDTRQCAGAPTTLNLNCNNSPLYEFKTPVGVGIPIPSIGTSFRALDYAQYPPGIGNVGGYGFGIQAESPGQIKSLHWPFLHINKLQLRMNCDTTPQNRWIDMNFPLQVNYALEGGRPEYEVTAQFGDGTPAQVNDERYGQFVHEYKREGAFQITLTAKDADNMFAYCNIVDVNVNLCNRDPGKIKALPTHTDPRTDMFGDCNVCFFANVRCGTASKVEWFFGDGESAVSDPICHAYHEGGMYHVTCDVTNADDPSDIYHWEKDIIACVSAIQVDCTGVVSPTQRLAPAPIPMPVTFDLSGKISGGAPPYECNVNYGDGTRSGWGSQYCRRHTHDYYPGDYQAYFDVRDSIGLEARNQCLTGIYVSGPECDPIRSIDLSYPANCRVFPYECNYDPCFQIRIGVQDPQLNDTISIDVYFRGQVCTTKQIILPATGTYQVGTTVCADPNGACNFVRGDSGFLEFFFNGSLCYRKGWAIPQ